MSNFINHYKVNLSICLLLVTAVACSEKKKLPIFGNRDVQVRIVNGTELIDTIYATVPDFKLVNQKGDTVTQNVLSGKIAVVDFFFTTCPTICPIMKKEMLRIYQEFKQRDDLILLSHTIDPEHDTLEVLADYAKRLGSDGRHWQFLTGERSYIYELAEKGYYATAAADSSEPGGFIHSGGFILIDKEKRVRGIYDGTSASETDQLIADINQLLNETL